MPPYRIKGSDGSIYTGTAPEGATDAEILAYVDANAQAANAQAADAQAADVQSKALQKEQRQTAPKADSSMFDTIKQMAGNTTLERLMSDLTGSGDASFRGNLAPVARTSSGEKRFGFPVIAEEIYNAVTAAEDSARGELTFPEMERRARGAMELATGTGVASKLAKFAPRAIRDSAETVTALRNMPAPQAPPKSLNDLKQYSEIAYKASEAAGDIMPPALFKRDAGNIVSLMKKEGYDEDVHKHVKQAMTSLNKRAGVTASGKVEPQTIRDLDNYRQVVGDTITKAANAKDYNEIRLGMILQDQVDNVIMKMDGSEDLVKAREIYTKVAKMRDIEDILDIAERLDDPTFIQRELKKIIKNTRKYNRYSPAEQKQLVKAANSNILDVVSKMAPDEKGFGLKNIAYGAAFVTNPLTAVLPAAGQVSKYLSPRVRRGRLNKLNQTISRGNEESTIFEKIRAQRDLRKLLNPMSDPDPIPPPSPPRRAKPGRTPKRRTPNSALFDAIESGRIS